MPTEIDLDLDNDDYHEGFTAYIIGLAFDHNESYDWSRGYLAAQRYFYSED